MKDTLARIKEIFSEALICNPEDIDVASPYVEMGVDSILAIQLVKLVYHNFKIKIKTADIFNSVSILDFTNFIDRKIANLEEAVTPDAMQSKTSSESINDRYAVIGMAGYFPGASDVNFFWKNLLEGKDSITQTDRIPNNKAGFVADAECFDPSFFGISPKEARLIDPQHRLFLEVAWHAFEDAGITKSQLEGSNCGVFVGSLPGDYKYLLQNTEDAFSPLAFTGNAFSGISGRISYTFNLKGPSLSIDTACSTSLVCLNSAIEALRSQSCQIALVGAASIFSTDEIFNFSSEANFLSKRSSCATFDASADGFVPSESVCAILIKRYDKAVQDGDQIHGIIKGIGVNHDGRTNGLMSPNSISQKELIHSVYKKYDVDPKQIGYVETHGTGTAVGDPIEIEALTANLSKQNSKGPYIGSCKANIGHALTASGLASIIKSLHILKYQKIPPQIHFKNINPEIEINNLIIPTALTVFPQDKSYVCVSAFGFTGTNAHLVLERYVEKKKVSKNKISLNFFVFSAKSKFALQKVLENMVTFLNENQDIDLTSLSYTLSCGRTFFKEARWVTAASSFSELIEAISKKITSFSSNESSKISIGFENSNQGIVDKIKKIISIESIDLEHLMKSDGFYDSWVEKISLPPYPFEKTRFWPTNKKIKNDLPSSSSKEIEEILKSHLSKILEYDADKIDMEKPFIDFGLDSLSAMELIKPLKKYHPYLSLNILFKEGNIKNLVNFLSTQTSKESPKKVEKTLKIQDFVPCRLENESSLEYLLCGDEGELLLLLPPLNTNADAWIQQARFFTNKKKRLLIPHYPAHSIKNRSISPGPVNLHEIARQILMIAKLESPKQKAFSVIGWSLGGCLALILGKEFTESIESIIITNSAAAFPSDLFGETISLRKDLEKYSQLLKQIFLSPNENPVELIQASCPLSHLQGYYEALEVFDIRNALSEIHQPVLVIHGELDPVIKKADIDIFRKIPNLTVSTFKNQGHFLPLTAANQFNQVAQEFLEDHSLAPF